MRADEVRPDGFLDAVPQAALLQVGEDVAEECPTAGLMKSRTEPNATVDAVLRIRSVTAETALARLLPMPKLASPTVPRLLARAASLAAPSTLASAASCSIASTALQNAASSSAVNG